MCAPHDDDLMQQPDTLQARKILKIQAILGLVSVACALPFGDSVALSVLIGAGVCLLANALLAVWVFRDYRAQALERLVLRFYGAETAKIVLILVLFAVAFATLDNLNIPALLGAYFVIQVAPTLIAAQSGNRTTK
ncbi:ATP synthase protein I [Thiobaca trueperi]|uniref:ATP synthase protein I n=2 Tax=Thiobaca trueperi TaxID=127458 RepID=A0A4R3MTT0_9GAMM|nr:ATP synthase protein I [Thiobaca trueperi]